MTDNSSKIIIQIFDIAGRLVRTFFLTGIGHRSSVTWQGDDQAGHAVPAGIYFCEAVVNGMKERQTLVLIR